MDSRIYILTHKRLTGQLSSVEATELSNLSLITSNQVLSEEIEYLWNVSNNYFPTKDWKKEDAKKSFLDKIKPPPPPTTRTIGTSNAAKYNWTRILGTAAALSLLGWLIFSMMNKKEVIKAVDEVEYAELFDETKVWLEKGARLTILEESSSQRKVALVGEAFFDVQHNPDRTFVIDLGNNIYSEVLGTTFKAKSTHDGENCVVSVREGRVRLYSTSNQEYDIIIGAGEEGLIDINNGPQRSKTIGIRPLLSTGHQITFDATPLDEVLDKLGLYFGVTFSYVKDAIQACRVSTVVPHDASLQDMIHSITDIHQNITVTSQSRNTYQVSGDCK